MIQYRCQTAEHVGRVWATQHLITNVTLIRYILLQNATWGGGGECCSHMTSNEKDFMCQTIRYSSHKNTVSHWKEKDPTPIIKSTSFLKIRTRKQVKSNIARELTSCHNLSQQICQEPLKQTKQVSTTDNQLHPERKILKRWRIRAE